MSGIIAVVLDESQNVVSVETDAERLLGTRVLVVTPDGTTADRVIFRANQTERPLDRLYAAEEAVERRERLATELARLMYEAGSVIKSERWDQTDVDGFLDRLSAGVTELKKSLGEDFDPADPLRQWAAWFDPRDTQRDMKSLSDELARAIHAAE